MVDIEKLLVNKQNILKNIQINWFDKKTKSTNKLFFLPSTYATSDAAAAAAAAEAGDDATTLIQYCLRFSIYLSTRKNPGV